MKNGHEQEKKVQANEELPLIVKITLVSDQHNGDPIRASEIQNLLTDYLGVLKALLAIDGVHNDVPVNASGVLWVHNGVFILRSGSRGAIGLSENEGDPEKEGPGDETSRSICSE